MSIITTVSSGSTPEPRSQDANLAASTAKAAQVGRKSSRGGSNPRGNLVVAVQEGERIFFTNGTEQLGELFTRRVGGSRGGKYIKIILSFSKEIKIVRERKP